MRNINIKYYSHYHHFSNYVIVVRKHLQTKVFSDVTVHVIDCSLLMPSFPKCSLA